MGKAIHPAMLDEDVLMKQCDVARGRASGPGGQHRNKVETAVTLTHRPTGISGQASERRSQVDNQKVALFRLRVALAVEHRAAVSPDAPLSALWTSRVKMRRLAINPTHRDFPALLAEALDRAAAHDFDVATAAAALDVSTSQWVKLVRHEPRALDMVNAARQQRGAGKLR